MIDLNSTFTTVNALNWPAYKVLKKRIHVYNN